MESLSFIFGVVGNVLSILVFASPVTTFWRIVKNKSTEKFKGLPYVCTLLSTSQWTYYGLIKPGGLLIVTVNGAGASLEAIFVALYLIYAPNKLKVKIARLVLLLNVAFFGVVVLVTSLALHRSIRINVVGALCAGLTLGMYASPMAAMRIVIVTKSVEFMPFFLSFFLFLNGGVWTAYAVLVRDLFIGVGNSCIWAYTDTHICHAFNIFAAFEIYLICISQAQCSSDLMRVGETLLQIPNGIGFVLGAAQLILYAIYRRSDHKNEEEGEDDGKPAGPVDVEMAARDELVDNADMQKGMSLSTFSLSK